MWVQIPNCASNAGLCTLSNTSLLHSENRQVQEEIAALGDILSHRNERRLCAGMNEHGFAATVKWKEQGIIPRKGTQRNKHILTHWK